MSNFITRITDLRPQTPSNAHQASVSLHKRLKDSIRHCFQKMPSRTNYGFFAQARTSLILFLKQSGLVSLHSSPITNGVSKYSS